MKRQVVKTSDGSSSMVAHYVDETYHSSHGAIQESIHVFIEMGLHELFSKSEEQIRILEVGFGTGLNALLTCIECSNQDRDVKYVGLEPYPLEDEELAQLNYSERLKCDSDWLKRLQRSEGPVDHFSVELLETTLQEFKSDEGFDLVYFDAFSPRSEPELWTLEIFKQLYGLMNKGGILVTYCSKGQVRRDMISAGFEVSKLPGPPGKREMLRAIK